MMMTNSGEILTLICVLLAGLLAYGIRAARLRNGR